MIEKYGAPTSEFNEDFVDKMRRRMALSYHKYGRMVEATGVDMVADIIRRVDKYKETGNTEWLIDAANVCLIEFTHPKHPEAHFRATDSDESIGRTHASETVMGTRKIVSDRHNLDVRGQLPE